jgi:hypothetical protein
VRFCQALWEYFYDIDNAIVVYSSTPLPSPSAATRVSDIPDTYVFAGNVYGIVDSFDKSWKELESYFGEAFCKKIKEHVKDKYFGEAPIYTSFVIPTGHAFVKNLVYVASNITKRPDPLHAYNCMFSALNTMQSYNSGKLNLLLFNLFSV